MAALPSVSIIIPTYNREELLRVAVKSVIAQTHDDWELIIADDGSTDGTRDYLADLNEPRIRIMLLEHDGNQSRVRNAAVTVARGEWIALLDSDDVWLPDKLAMQLSDLARRPECGWSCTGLGFIDEQGRPTPRRAGVPYHPYSGWILEALLTFDAAATTTSLLVRRSLLADVGGFDERFPFRGDYELELRLAARSELCALAEPLVLLRQHSSRSTSMERVSNLYRENARIFRSVEQTTSDQKIRGICRRQYVIQLVGEARALSREGDQRASLVCLARALREAPTTGEVWRSILAVTLHAMGVRHAPG